MITGARILVTGAGGRVAFPIVRALARANEVWAVARFSNPRDRPRLEELGVRCVPKDLGRDPLTGVPNDFDYVFHAAAAYGDEAELHWPAMFETNVQATGQLMRHVGPVRGFVFCSTGSVYRYQGARPLSEDDPLGIHIGSYSLSKIAAESLVRFLSREYEIPATIIRIFSTYGPEGGAPAFRLQALLEEREIVLHPDRPNRFNPIYEDDYVTLGIRALEVAQPDPIIVNWAGSETVSAEDYCAYLAELVGAEPRFRYGPEAYTPLWPDVTRMHSVLGRTHVPWRAGMRRMVEALHPNRLTREPGGESGS